MRPCGEASGGSWGHEGKGQRRDNAWYRSGDNWNGGPWPRYDDSPPPVSCSDSRGRNANPVSGSEWQRTPTNGGDSRAWNENPASRSGWQSSSTWQHNPPSGSTSRSSNRWQQSQPAVAAAVNTNAPDTMYSSGCSHTDWAVSAPARAPLGPWHQGYDEHGGKGYNCKGYGGGSNSRKGYDEHWLARVNNDIDDEDGSFGAWSTRVQQDVTNQRAAQVQQDIINEERRRDSGHQRGSQRTQAAAHAAPPDRKTNWTWLDEFQNEEFNNYLRSKAQEVQAAAHAGREHTDTRGTAARAQTARDTGGAPEAAHRWWRAHAEHDVSSICRGAIANEIAAAHANEYPIPDAVSCDAAFFKASQVNVHYSQHNDALKIFREEAECGELGATSGRRAFDFGQAQDIRRLVRKQSGGEDFLFDHRDEGRTAWIWESMIAHLDDASIDFVVNGTSTPDKSAVATSLHADNEDKTDAEAAAQRDVHGNSNKLAIVPYPPRARAIVGCEFVMDTNRVDHKRHAAAKKASLRRCQPWPEEKRLYKWAFMIKRDDGTVCLLEPTKGPKVDMYEGVSAVDLPVPRNGLGGSDFKGDYRRRIRTTLHER